MPGFIKRGENIEISPANVQAVETIEPIIDDTIIAEMRKYVSQIKTAAVNGKKIAPKADDFLYFSAVMMHAAEAALVNEDGTPKMTSKGEQISAFWDKTGGSWRWKCNDSMLKPYKNSNGDIFPEEELVKAYKKWIGRPLCIDHKSSSVDHVRGFIVDTYYDRNLKRVIALCALDKKNYPDLARKIETGYSNSVSMGTAVERAICYDCGTVARTEHDFCNHMRSKSCYGEINVGLSPMELSIVVTGADPQAKIKHIIAMANTLNNYVEEKSAQLAKLAAAQFTANISIVPDLNNANNSMQLNVNASDLDAFRSSVNEAIDSYKKLQLTENEQNSENNTNDTAFNQSSGKIAMDETDLPNTDYSDAPPHARFASSGEELEQELESIKASIGEKLAKMQEDLNKIANTLINNKEEIMSGNKDNINKQGYYQGAGGDNEPTPGQKKYPVDPTQEKLRDDNDKQMVGQKPFPEVGQVDDLYPGYESFPSGELERKKMLARAEAEDRAMRRTAVINKAKDALEAAKKEAYFNNGEPDSNPNTPTPHKTKYKADPLQDQLRDKEDKQMVGQKPFPEVGPVDGMHPSPDSADQRDELKRKELLRRAGYRARFIRAANEDGSTNKANSSWEVLQGDNLVLSKTVNELSGGNSEHLFSGIATEAFGKDLMNKVKSLGVQAVDSLFKGAQAAPALPPAPEASAPVDGEDTGKEGDPKETALELSEKIRDLSSDLVEAVRALTGEQAEMGDMGAPLAADDSKTSTAALNAMRKDLNGALTVALKEAVAGLNDHERELSTIVALYNKGSVVEANKDFVGSIVEDAITEAKQALADSFKLLGAFVKYARGTHAIEKRAAEEAELNKHAHGDHMSEELENKEIMDMLGETGSELSDLSSELEEEHEHDEHGHDLVSDMLADDLANVEAAADDNDAVMTSDPAKAAELAKKDPGVQVELKSAASKEERQALRAKLAAGLKWNPVMSEFHKHLEDPTFDIKPSNDGGHFETIDEIHDAMLDVATSGPRVRKQAAEIQKLVSEGKLKTQDFDLLIANGVDPAAVKYWKELWGEAGPEGKEFANELVKTHAKAQAEEDKNTYRVKIARAYELAYEMVSRGLLPENHTAISAQVDEIMKWNDQGFESMKKVIAMQQPSMQKSAGRMPQVGLFGSEDANSGNKSDYDLLVEAFAGSKSKRMF